MNEGHAEMPSRCSRCLYVVPMVVGSLLTTPVAAQDEVRRLFDGKSLDGWETLQGDAYLWKVVDGIITAGSLTEKVPHNSFRHPGGKSLHTHANGALMIIQINIHFLYLICCFTIVTISHQGPHGGSTIAEKFQFLQCKGQGRPGIIIGGRDFFSTRNHV